MALHDTNLFPSVSGVVSDLAGGMTLNIFENVEAVVRAIGAHRFLTLVRSTTQPSSPTQYMFWVKPAALNNGALSPSDLKVYVDGAWVANSPEVFAKSIIYKANIQTSVKTAFPLIGAGTDSDKVRISTAGLTKDSILRYNASNQTIAWVDAEMSGGVVLV